MRKTRIGRVRIPLRYQFRRGFVRYVENDCAAIQVADVNTVGTFGIDVGVVNPVVVAATRIVRRMRIKARQGGRLIALARARQPPASRLLRFGRIAHVDDAITLIVTRVAGREIRCPAGAVNVLAIDKPDAMHTPRLRSRAIEERDRTRVFRHGNIEQLDAGVLDIPAIGLIGDGHDIAGNLQRVRGAYSCAAGRFAR